MENEERQQLIRELSQPLHAGKGWLTFLGIVTIISGVLAALSIIGLLYAWLPIWMGVLLLQASNALDTARNSGDQDAFMRATGKIRTYFIICSVMVLVTFVLTFLGFMFGMTMGIIGAMNSASPTI